MAKKILEGENTISSQGSLIDLSRSSFYTQPNFRVVKYNSKISNNYYHIKFGKSIMNRCSIKKLLLKILKNEGLQSCNFIKKRLQHRCFPVNIAKLPIFLFKKTPTQVFSCEYCKISKNTCFEEHL